MSPPAWAARAHSAACLAAWLSACRDQMSPRRRGPSSPIPLVASGPPQWARPAAQKGCHGRGRRRRGSRRGSRPAGPLDHCSIFKITPHVSLLAVTLTTLIELHALAAQSTQCRRRHHCRRRRRRRSCHRRCCLQSKYATTTTTIDNKMISKTFVVYISPPTTSSSSTLPSSSSPPPSSDTN